MKLCLIANCQLITFLQYTANLSLSEWIFLVKGGNNLEEF